jgi:hypothetical protein
LLHFYLVPLYYWILHLLGCSNFWLFLFSPFFPFL